MNLRDRPVRVTRKAAVPPLVSLLLAVVVLTATASAHSQTLKAPSECIGVATGAPWSYKGSKGNTYTVLGVSGASCAIGLKYMPKWTRDRATFDLKPVPAGWHCTAIGDYSGLAKLGQCTTSKGGILEWIPKQKK